MGGILELCHERWEVRRRVGMKRIWIVDETGELSVVGADLWMLMWIGD